jgi:hypothetical protein
MSREFESILTSDLDFLFENARLEARPALRALAWNIVLDALDPVPLDSFDFSEGCLTPMLDLLVVYYKRNWGTHLRSSCGEVSWIQSYTVVNSDRSIPGQENG